jgi:ABC-type transport system involved in multi-copper enzyme maturation permease subunit
VLWESAVVATMITFGIAILSLIVYNKSTIERLLSSEWSRDVVRGLYYLLPKVTDIGNMMMQVVKGEPIESWMPVLSTALFGLVCLGGGIYIFEKKNY